MNVPSAAGIRDTVLDDFSAPKTIGFGEDKKRGSLDLPPSSCLHPRATGFLSFGLRSSTCPENPPSRHGCVGRNPAYSHPSWRPLQAGMVDCFGFCRSSPRHPACRRPRISEVNRGARANRGVLRTSSFFGRSRPEAGGGGGIRTHGRLRDDGFQDRYHRPLGHPSPKTFSVYLSHLQASTNLRSEARQKSY